MAGLAHHAATSSNRSIGHPTPSSLYMFFHPISKASAPNTGSEYLAENGSTTGSMSDVKYIAPGTTMATKRQRQFTRIPGSRREVSELANIIADQCKLRRLAAEKK